MDNSLPGQDIKELDARRAKHAVIDPKETFGATAKVHVTIEVDLKQAWGDEEVGIITRRTRDEARSFITQICQKQSRIKLVSIGDCFVSLHSRK